MSKTIVTYFSASGVTGQLADRLAKAIDAPCYEIRPAVRYTNADLDWQNKTSRSSVEMSDRACRPALADNSISVADADVVLVGFPIWWYREPSIIDTFIESYDFAGKTIVPFATSGMSPIGDSGANLQALAPAARVLTGARLDAHASANELKGWFDSLGL